MSSMQFMEPLKSHLRRFGKIYTVRKYQMAEADVLVDGVGVCHRMPLGEVHRKEELDRYLDRSGFKNLEDWWKMIRWFIPTNGPYYLYAVTRCDSN